MSAWFSLRDPAPCRITIPPHRSPPGRSSTWASGPSRTVPSEIGGRNGTGRPTRRTPNASCLRAIMAAATFAVYPEAASAEDGRLAIGGCDAVELAREFGTPAYVMAEDDLRARARAFR